MSTNFSDYTAMAQAGVKALQSGDARTACAHFEQVAAAGGADQQLWFALAIARHSLGELEGVHEAVDQILKTDPRNLRALIMKGDCYSAQNNGRAAVSFYSAVIAMAPDLSRLPPHVVDEIRRVQAAREKYAADMSGHLREMLAQAGYDEKNSSRRFTESIEMLSGVKRRYEEEPKTYYFPGLPPKGYYDRDSFPWSRDLEACTDDIAEELDAAMRDGADFHPYVQKASDRANLKQHNLLNSLDWSALYLWRHGIIDEENAARFPKTMAALDLAPLDRVDDRAPIALFSKLTPGTRIEPHTGLLNTRLICHLPIIVPGRCFLRVGNDVREWKRAEMLAFNDSIEHEAWNDSQDSRIILLFSIWRPELTEEEKRLVAVVHSSALTYVDNGG